jgi:hypothetical protein
MHGTSSCALSTWPLGRRVKWGWLDPEALKETSHRPALASPKMAMSSGEGGSSSSRWLLCVLIQLSAMAWLLSLAAVWHVLQCASQTSRFCGWSMSYCTLVLDS